MPPPEKPAHQWLDVLRKLLAGLAGLCMLGYLGVVALLTAVSLPNLSRRELMSTAPTWTTAPEIYLRNRTAAPLRVALTVARPALRPDTVWWGVAVSPEAIGQALALRDSLVSQGMLPAPPPAARLYHLLPLRVQWADAQGRLLLLRPPMAALLELPEAEATLPGVGQHLVRRYWDCR